tara:strand:+ start:599 stop:718 length:120 start_codon:yes stop_codon:yes gene_type:complete
MVKKFPSKKELEQLQQEKELKKKQIRTAQQPKGVNDVNA